MLKWIARIEAFVDEFFLWLEERHQRIEAKKRYDKYIEETKGFWKTHCHVCGSTMRGKRKTDCDNRWCPIGRR